MPKTNKRRAAANKSVRGREITAATPEVLGTTEPDRGSEERQVATMNFSGKDTPPRSPCSHTTASSSSGSSLMIPVDAVAQLYRQIRNDDRPLPSFGGDVLEWPGFIDKYRRTAKDQDITDDVKRDRLDKALYGDARRLVQYKLHTTVFLDEVIEELEEEYGGADAVIKTVMSHVKKVRRLDSKLTRIGEFVNDTLRLQKMVQLCKINSLELPILLILKEYLPTVALMRWGDYQRQIGRPEQGSLKDLVDCMTRIKRECGHDIVHCQESSRSTERDASHRNTSSEDNTTSRSPGYNSKSSKAGYMLFQGTTECVICRNSDHQFQDCPSFKEGRQQERFMMMRKFKRCSYCCGSHILKDCEEYEAAHRANYKWTADK